MQLLSVLKNILIEQGNREDLGDFIDEDGTYGLNIITSILYPKKLSYKPENRLIMIKNDGDLVVEEFVNLQLFTKIQKANIIIYYE